MIHNAGFAAINYIATFVVLVPMPFHFANRNVAVCCLFATISFGCLFTAINATIWQEIKNPVVTAPGYCDVIIRFVDMMHIICLGCGLAILRYLSNILLSRGASATTRANKTRQILVDLAIIYTLPILALVIQGLFFNAIRYSIAPTVGCRLLLPNTKLAIIYYLPGPILALACTVYATLIIWALYRKRKEFQEVLHSSRSGLSAARFIRLFLLALVTLLFFVPLAIYRSYYTFNQILGPGANPTPYKLSQLAPWYDNDKGKIIVLYGYINSVSWRYWIIPLPAFFFTALFGVGREANKAYKQWLRIAGLGKLVEHVEKIKMPKSASWMSSRLMSLGRSKSSMTTSRSTSEDLSSQSFEKGDATVSMQTDSTSDLDHRDDLELGKGHNQIITSKSQARVWSEAGLPCSPHKIKVFSESAQSSE
jgi:pheromone a factor receptor